jgi:uncharacterized membrane protein
VTTQAAEGRAQRAEGERSGTGEAAEGRAQRAEGERSGTGERAQRAEGERSAEDPLAPWSPPPLLLAGLAAAGLLFFAYPFLIQQAEARFGTRAVAAGFLALGLSTFVRRGPVIPLGDASRPFPVPYLGALRIGCLALLLGALASGDRRWLLLLPAAIQLFLAGAFAASLRDVPMIERAARFLQPRAPAFIAPYCGKVTLFWSVLFAVNALAIGALVLLGAEEAWRVFTGWGLYVSLGILTGVEYFVRKTWFRYYGAHFVDRLWARLLPPEDTERGRRSLEYIRRMHDDMREAGLTPPEEATPR